jgi:hypothetical protein
MSPRRCHGREGVDGRCEGVFDVALILGAVVVLLTLPNRRDRRASRLRHFMLDQLALPELRGRVGVHIQCAVLSWRRAVIVDLLAGTPHEVWNVFTRLASRLPPRVRLGVHGMPDSGFTVMTRILVPTDFSDPSLAAVRSGIEPATSVGGVVLLLHVVEEASVRCYAIGGLPLFLSDMIDWGGEYFRSRFDQHLIRRDLCEEARWKLDALFHQCRCEVSRPAASPRRPNGHQDRGHRVHVPPAPFATVRAAESERGLLSGELSIPRAFT